MVATTPACLQPVGLSAGYSRAPLAVQAPPDLPETQQKHQGGQSEAARCRIQCQGPALPAWGQGVLPRTHPFWHRVPQTFALVGWGAGAHLPLVQSPHGGPVSPGRGRGDTMAPMDTGQCPEGAVGRGPARPTATQIPGSGAGWHRGLKDYAPGLGGRPAPGRQGDRGGRGVLAHLCPPARPWHHCGPAERAVSLPGPGCPSLSPVGTCTQHPPAPPVTTLLCREVLTSLPGGPASPLSP